MISWFKKLCGCANSLYTYKQRKENLKHVGSNKRLEQIGNELCQDNRISNEENNKSRQKKDQGANTKYEEKAEADNDFLFDNLESENEDTDNMTRIKNEDISNHLLGDKVEVEEEYLNNSRNKNEEIDDSEYRRRKLSRRLLGDKVEVEEEDFDYKSTKYREVGNKIEHNFLSHNEEHVNNDSNNKLVSDNEEILEDNNRIDKARFQEIETSKKQGTKNEEHERAYFKFFNSEKIDKEETENETKDKLETNICENLRNEQTDNIESVLGDKEIVEDEEAEILEQIDTAVRLFNNLDTIEHCDDFIDKIETLLQILEHLKDIDDDLYIDLKKLRDEIFKLFEEIDRIVKYF